MKTLKIFSILTACLLLFSRCDDFGDVNRDPDSPSIANTRSLFLAAAGYTSNFGWMGNYNPWNQLYPQYITECTNVQYTKFLLSTFGVSNYYRYAIRNLEVIIRYNQSEWVSKETWVSVFGDAGNQIGVAETLRAFYFMHLTDILGMIPYSEANKAEEGIYTPKYDTQEFIYADLDKRLTDAYKLFQEEGRLDSEFEIFYNGDVSKWKKLNASLRMMMAIKLAKVAPAVAKERFARAYADGGMTDNRDLLEYKYLPENANANPLWTNMIQDARKDFVPCAQIVDQLKAFNDPRLKAYCVPNEKGKYRAIPFGTLSEVLSTEWQAGTYCNFNPRYYEQDAPWVLITPSYIYLLEAEAAVRGWITADAEGLYKAGIRASFDQHPETSGYDFDAYYSQSGVKLTGSPEEKLAKIGLQAWLANYMQDGVEAWSTWRRLGVPLLKPGNANADPTLDHVPYRLCYSSSDFTTNQANYDAAIAQQGADSFHTRVWWNSK